jgi:hypothetical protein
VHARVLSAPLSLTIGFDELVLSVANDILPQRRIVHRVRIERLTNKKENRSNLRLATGNSEELLKNFNAGLPALELLKNLCSLLALGASRPGIAAGGKCQVFSCCPVFTQIEFELIEADGIHGDDIQV